MIYDIYPRALTRTAVVRTVGNMQATSRLAVESQPRNAKVINIRTMYLAVDY